MKKFCCERFQSRYELENTYGLNIRIIKLSEDYLKASHKRGFPVKDDDLYNFIISESYDKDWSDKKQYFFIENCPFCGSNLKEQYSDDLYINETTHSW